MSKQAHYVDLNHIYLESENDTHKITKMIFEHSVGTIMSPEYKGQNEGDVITVLRNKVSRETIMSDSWMEKDTNRDFVENAKGDILIAGLGLGMVLLAIQAKREVKSILVVERSRELASLVLPQLEKHLLDKVTIVYSDIFEYETKQKFNTIYFDIWNGVGEEGDYEQMQELKKKFKKNRVKPIKQSPISCWRERDCRLLTREARSGRGERIWW